MLRIFNSNPFRPSPQVASCTLYSHDNLGALEARGADLAVSAEIEDPPEWLSVHPLVRDPLILITTTGAAIDLDSPMVRFNRAQHIARLIEAHLRRVRLSPARRFEVESNKAMVALVARSRGWAMTTPLGLLCAGRDADLVDAHPLPFPELARTLALCARGDLMGTLPSAVAAVFRNVIAERAVPDVDRRMPWLGDRFRVLGNTE